MAGPRQELRKEAILNRARPDDLTKKSFSGEGLEHPLLKPGLGGKITVQSCAAIKPYKNC